MASNIILTHTLPKQEMVMAYQIPDTECVSDIKLVVNNYEGNNKPDTIVIRTVGEQGRQLNGSGELEWIATGTPVTQDEKDQRQLYRGTLKGYERYVEENIQLGSGDQFRTRSTAGYCNMIVYGNRNVGEDRVSELKGKILDGSATYSEKEELALLTGGVINTNNCTNNCSCP